MPTMNPGKLTNQQTMIPQEQTCATPDNHELGALVYLLTMTPES
jgi:hypothetical protein